MKGATGVTFNGTAAIIFFDAPTAILAKVPAGATSGEVVVTTPSHTLSSNIAFDVVP